MQQNLGFFAHMFGSMMTSMNETVRGSESGVVGKRKRVTRWDQRRSEEEEEMVMAGSSVDYDGVPPERAIVLAGSQSGR